MLGLFKAQNFEDSATGFQPRQTDRLEWEPLMREVYSRVVDGCRFGIGVLTEEKGLLSSKMIFRLNQNYPDQEIVQFVRRKFDCKSFAHFFPPGAGVSVESATGLLKVVDGSLGLPGQSLVAPFQQSSNSERRAVVIFGGTRLEGQMEARLRALDEVLASELPTTLAKGLPSVAGHGELRQALNRLNMKRLFDYELEQLAAIVNGLEETKEQLPRTMKPKFNTVNQFLLAKRLRK